MSDKYEESEQEANRSYMEAKKDHRVEQQAVKYYRE
jgi:hypothetical protein